MSKFLKEYELTDEGKKFTNIVIPANRQGDKHHDFPVANMTDYMAKELLERKDGRGAKFVRKKETNKVEKK